MAELLIVGAGSRGTAYASYALQHPDRAQVVGIAEPRAPWRDPLARAHGLTPDQVAADWRALADRPRFADAAVIATQDTLHAEPAIAFARQGYHLLLEKPMAPNPDDCRRIVDEAVRAGILFAVCHVLRYTDYTRTLRNLVTDGLIGDVVNIQSLEPVGYWHQAHSFVRGNWRREDESSPMLLAKCCHDLDWIRFVMGTECTSVQSFGSLFHFRPEHKPAGATPRCLDCPHDPRCPYSARKIYLDRVANGQTGWPVDVLTPNPTVDTVTKALRTGPYGRCVYDCDNDVVDHQVVNLQFAAGQTASLTMTAFNQAAHRQTRVFGTHGELVGNGSTIQHFDFLSDSWTPHETQAPDASILGGHGGGDYGLMHAFIHAVNLDDPSTILSGPRETLESHLITFAAEQSRLQQRVVHMHDMLPATS